MAANQSPWPREWLMTDERIGDRLWEAIEALPSGGGVVFRHYSLSEADRRELGLRVAEMARERGLVLAVAGSRRLADELRAQLVHNPDEPGVLRSSLAVHDLQQADPTRSHPGARHLGTDEAVALAKMAGCPAIALGGMDQRRFEVLQAATSNAFHGYAGIDCWLRG
jgi:thiamine-phosphate pyrophosphorylase